MIFKTLGTLDLLAVILLIGAAIFPKSLLLYAGAYLLLKGIIFIITSKDIASYGDALSGAYLALLSFGTNIEIIGTIVLIYLAQKTLLTFVKIGIETYSIYKLLKYPAQKANPETSYFYVR